MSDDDYDHDYDEYAGFFDSEDEAPDGLAEYVDSLTEHTNHSPILVNAHPDYDIEWDEWEYLTDEYYDAEHENAAAARRRDALEASQMNGGKRKRGNNDQNAVPEKHKRRKVVKERMAVERPQPLVIWKERKERSGKSVPLVQPEDGKRVALLENWRDIVVKGSTTPKQSHSEDAALGDSEEDDVPGTERKNSQKKLAVSRQSDKLKVGETRLDRQNGPKILQTEHPRSLETRLDEDNVE